MIGRPPAEMPSPSCSAPRSSGPIVEGIGIVVLLVEVVLVEVLLVEVLVVEVLLVEVEGVEVLLVEVEGVELGDAVGELDGAGAEAEEVALESASPVVAVSDPQAAAISAATPTTSTSAGDCFTNATVPDDPDDTLAT